MDRLGDFELLKRLGAGAQAEVFLAADRDGHLVALKVMLEHLTLKDDARKAFMREARTSTLLKHPNLCETYEVAEDNGRPYISMELVRGWSVSSLVKKLRASNERLNQDEAAELVRQAALGLHFAHEVKGPGGTPLGLVHRDVSPQNIMVSEDGVAKVVDFGLAKATLAPETVTTTLKGKLRYMPPEQLKSQPIDRRADVFALGAVLWELACGVPLHPGASEAEVFQQALYNPQPHPDEVAKGLSRQMVDVLVKATERNLDKRMATAAQLAEALAGLSSPSAREKLGLRAAKFFEPIPKTLDEARGLEPSAVTSKDSSPGPGRPSRKSGAVLPPPPRSKPPSYIGPPVPDEPLPGVAPLVDPDARERRTDVVKPLEGDNTEANTDSTLQPLLNQDTQASITGRDNPAIQTIDESDLSDLEPTRSMMTPPPRRLGIAIAVASIAMVVLGAVVGAAIRARHSGDDDMAPMPDAVGVPVEGSNEPDVPAQPDDATAAAAKPGRPKPRTAQRAEAERLFQEAQGPFASGSFGTARSKLEKCVKVDKTYPDCHKLLGATLAMQGDGAGGAKQYEIFLKLVPPDDPNAARVRQLLEQYRGGK